MLSSKFNAIFWSFPLLCITVDSHSTNYSTASQYPFLIDATTESLETGLESGLFTSVDLVNTYVARLLEVNATLHVLTELNPDALMIAAELDAERASGTTRGALRTYDPDLLSPCARLVA